MVFTSYSIILINFGDLGNTTAKNTTRTMKNKTRKTSFQTRTTKNQERLKIARPKTQRRKDAKQTRKTNFSAPKPCHLQAFFQADLVTVFGKEHARDSPP
jgi:hypothetical protein